MKFSTYLPFCAARAEAIPAPLFSFVGRLKTVCFCLLHEDLFDFFLGSSLGRFFSSWLNLTADH